jgi:hypothetical protein
VGPSPKTAFISKIIGVSTSFNKWLQCHPAQLDHGLLAIFMVASSEDEIQCVLFLVCIERLHYQLALVSLFIKRTTSGRRLNNDYFKQYKWIYGL